MNSVKAVALVGVLYFIYNLYADNLQRNVRYRLNFYLHDKQLVYVHPSLYDGNRLTLASLLVAVEEIVRLLLT